jgi:hypothetical protein
MVDLLDQRKTDNKQVWIAGCSVADGVALDPNLRYGQLVGDYLKLPVSFLSYPGSGIPFSADQILRSDIRPNDIVIWQLTSVNRLVTYVNGSPFHVYNHVFDHEHIQSRLKWTFQIHPEYEEILSDKKYCDGLLKRIVHDDVLFEAIKSVSQVVNFCKKTNVNLYIFSIENITIPAIEEKFQPFIKGLDECVLLSDTHYIPPKERLKLLMPVTSFLDLASDNAHPGPNQHKKWSEELLQHIKNREK